MKKELILNKSLIKDCAKLLIKGKVRVLAPSLQTYKLASMYRKPIVLDFFKHGADELPEEKGIAFLWRDSDSLYVIGCFEDSDVFNSATKKNEKTWRTGDVMEFFFQPSGENEYYELHVTPENATLELCIPGVEKFGKVPFESQFYESNFFSYAERFNEPECQGWFGYMKIPFKGLGITDDKLEKSRFSVCRYNYNKKWAEPEQSSTTIYMDGGFHQPGLWHEIAIQGKERGKKYKG